MRIYAIYGIALGLALSVPNSARAAAGDGLAGSAHDFTAESTTTVGLCTFCHTPHRAQTTKLLWNHKLSAETYDWGTVTATTNGTPFPTFDASWSGVSKNCLSCHDGTVAVGDVAWFRATPDQSLYNHQHDDPNDPYLITVQGGGNLAGNHPTAFPFPFQSQTSTYNGVANDPGVIVSGWKADPRTEGIRLFEEVGGEVVAGATAGSTGIECSSCHEPHNGSLAVEDFFLRGMLTGNDTSYICLKCHSK